MAFSFHTFVRPLAASLIVTSIVAFGGSSAQSSNPTDALPNPFRSIDDFFKLPDGRTWGAVSAVDIDKDGTSIWIAERCGGNSNCMARPTVDPILLYDKSGKLVRSFGAGMLASPHGIYVDRDGNVWVTDYSDNAPR
ncbi:MAG TPA: hypothetical protein VJP86_15060, partial [Vicinamibacterales bacterium]|nr:hypothetical protein [Vicinamibacterales bacterium]